jgi:uncharacterized membrane protein (DUF2068 family)
MPRVAAALVIVFLIVMWTGIHVRRNVPNLEALLGQGIGPTGAAFVTPLALISAVGLWLRTAWGWWFSLVIIAYETISYLLFVVIVLASEDLAGVLTWATALSLLVLLTVVLLPDTRRACLRSRADAR